MRTVIQRVSACSVRVDGNIVGSIGNGLLVLVGICDEDTQEDIEWLCKKIAGLRIFNDENGVMNRSVMDIGGDVIAVSQFTLMAMTKKGNRPSYIKAAKAEFSEPMYRKFCETLEKETGRKVERGIFGADMKVSLLNDGPVTILIDTKNRE
ncbi:MAG: D-aminoacyl-tRNA deacylase [Bacteroidaceae bacterium]|nr:D-aminoacyl-tRNA deacylase [Bacteroidaceae bacterium]